MILLAQLLDQLARRGFLGLGLRPARRAEEELRIILAAELMTEDAKRARAIAERLGHLGRGPSVHEVGP